MTRNMGNYIHIDHHVYFELLTAKLSSVKSPDPYRFNLDSYDLNCLVVHIIYLLPSLML